MNRCDVCEKSIPENEILCDECLADEFYNMDENDLDLFYEDDSDDIIEDIINPIKGIRLG